MNALVSGRVKSNEPFFHIFLGLCAEISMRSRMQLLYGKKPLTKRTLCMYNGRRNEGEATTDSESRLLPQFEDKR